MAANLGKVMITTEGKYVTGIRYREKSIVMYKGNTYISLKDTAEEPADDGVNWMMLLEGVPIATSDTVGKSKPDGETITIDEDGTLHGASQVPEGVTFVDLESSGEALPEKVPVNADQLGGQSPEYYANVGDISILFQQQNFLYTGKDLTKVFAEEIAKFTDEWAWIKNRIANANYEGIYIGDYIPVTVNGEVMEEQVAGIDTYYRTTDQNVGHHIDFISKDCFSQTAKWNETNDNNGNAESPYPYMVSNLYKFLNETLYAYLPDKLKNKIANKRSLLEQRYSASGKLTDSTSWGWQDMGKLWVPHEFEVFGSIVWGTKGWSEGQAMQYPIFTNSYLNRIKRAGNGGKMCNWWLASVDGNSTNACGVNRGGYAYTSRASDGYWVPLCFRITA